MSGKGTGSWRVKPNRQSSIQNANVTYRVREDAANDALDLLPLSFLPLQTKSLQRACLRKNARLQSVVELFADAGAGSGQINCDKLHIHFGWPEGEEHPDQIMMTALSQLTSYDVYSLRIAMRELGIPLADHAALQLSDSKKAQLTTYMKSFTAPLIQQIFGQPNTNMGDFDNMVGMFKNPDKEAAMRNLRLMAQQLNIELQEVPKFLEDYGDVFLSLAYFQEILDGLIPRCGNFIGELRTLRSGNGLKHNELFLRGSQGIERALTNTIASITGRFDSFNTNGRDMWQDINAESFEQTRNLITAHHKTVGGVLCGLMVKITGWEDAFDGLAIEQQQHRRSEYILTEIRAGIDQIEKLETSARALSLPSKKKATNNPKSLGAIGLLLVEQLLPWYELSINFCTV